MERNRIIKEHLDPDPKNTIEFERVAIDSIKLEIFYNRLYRSLEEAKEVLMHISGSPVARDCGEVAVSFFTPNGDSVLMAAGVFVHVNTVSRAIKYMIRDKYEEDVGFNDDDQFINNDPHIGGMHAPDFLIIAPVFYHGAIVGWVGSFTHSPEVGAIEPGGQCASATERCHEGILLPCVKIIDKGRLKRDITQMISKFVRDSRILDLDNAAKIGANERAAKRIRELIDEFGVDFFMAATRQLVEEGEAVAREKIKGFKPGVYRSRGYVDNVGTEDELLVVQEVAMEVTEDGRMIFRAPVIGKETRTIANCALPGTEGLIFSALITQLFYDCRWNGGTFKALEMDIPRGSHLNVNEDIPVALCPGIPGMQVMGLLNIVFSQLSFVGGRYRDIMSAMPIGDFIRYGGIDQFGRRCSSITLDLVAMGMGARYDRDGVNTGAAHWSVNSDCADVESWEMTGPIVYLCRKQIPDSGGIGKYRGGVGFDALYLFSKTPQISFGSCGYGRHVATTPGIWGAYPACCARREVVQNTDFFERIKNRKQVPHSMSELSEYIEGNHQYTSPNLIVRPGKEGDIIAVRFLGGGGLGDPIEREPELVVKDLEDGLTTFRTAKEICCVVINSETSEIDYKKTKEIREARREERLAKGIPAGQYIKEMVEKRKKRELPEVVLNLFDEMVPYSEGLRRELKFEEELAVDGKGERAMPGGNVKDFLDLTPYVKVVEDEKGKKFAVCSICEYVYCDASRNYKIDCLVYDRGPKEIQPGRLGPDPDWMIYREFYCPGCGTQVCVEATPPGSPILHDIELKF